MQKLEPLTVENHQHLKITKNYTGKAIFNQSTFPILITEFEQIQREYPIALFRSPLDGKLSVHALTSLEEGTNQFIKNEKWQAQYIPLFVHCHPFALSNSNGAKPCLKVNSLHVAFENGTEPLFHEDGTDTEFLYAMRTSMVDIQNHYQITQGFLDFVEKHNLSEPLTIRFEDEEGALQQKEGILTVQLVKFHQLPDDVKLAAIANGFYQAIVLINASLHSFALLLNK
ncbi:SapC family protein [Alteromonas sp. KC3]|uniref:SapC family protein n=1 Tax=unclassified Alteromonas TaxID=2614992 RepID=UPI001924B35C|nr:MULTISPECIES: SapC family protein [unclassified Alteromonas]BCO18803.1 SapC family protein [Alteromonas sp. KC3]BCO22766.1 SapC family protein [Alteromonas sp. KC14]